MDYSVASTVKKCTKNEYLVFEQWNESRKCLRNSIWWLFVLLHVSSMEAARTEQGQLSIRHFYVNSCLIESNMDQYILVFFDRFGEYGQSLLFDFWNTHRVRWNAYSSRYRYVSVIIFWEYNRHTLDICFSIFFKIDKNCPNHFRLIDWLKIIVV